LYVTVIYYYFKESEPLKLKSNLCVGLSNAQNTISLNYKIEKKKKNLGLDKKVQMLNLFKTYH